jgi:hypothetical protein
MGGGLLQKDGDDGRHDLRQVMAHIPGNRSNRHTTSQILSAPVRKRPWPNSILSTTGQTEVRNGSVIGRVGLWLQQCRGVKHTESAARLAQRLTRRVGQPLGYPSDLGKIGHFAIPMGTTVYEAR